MGLKLRRVAFGGIENEVREAFRPSEKVAIAETIKALAGERRGGPPDRGQKQSGQLSALVPAGKETREVIAEQVGFDSYKTYEQAKAVVERGASELIEAMNAGRIAVSVAARNYLAITSA